MKRTLLLTVTVAACTTIRIPEPLPSPGAPQGPSSEETTTPAATLPAITVPAPIRHEEVRALWVVRTTLTSPDNIRVMVASAARAGFNTLFVQVRGRGDAYFSSALEPRAEALSNQPPDFDPLQVVLDEAHPRGISVHAWLNTHLVSDLSRLPADGRHLVHQAPDLLAVPRELAEDLYERDPFAPGYTTTLLRWSQRNSRRVEGLYTSPINPAVHDRIVPIWLDLVERYAVDGIHFDYVRFPGEDYDYSRGGVEAFRDWARLRAPRARTRELDRLARTDPLVWPDSLPDMWDDFRRARLTALVERIRRGVKQRRPDLVISAAVIADAPVAESRHFQAWPSWVESGLLDVAVPMAYTDDDGRFRLLVARAVRVADGPERIWAGIGTYLTGFQGTVTKIGIAREVGAGGISLFSYDWASAQRPGRDGVAFLDRVGQAAFGPR